VGMLWAPKIASSKPAWPVLAYYASGYRTVETMSSHWQVVVDQVNRSWVCNGSRTTFQPNVGKQMLAHRRSTRTGGGVVRCT